MGIQIAYISDRTNPFRAVRQSPKLASQAANVNINAPVITERTHAPKSASTNPAYA